MKKMFLALTAAAASCTLAAAPQVSREETEWCQMYWFDTHKTNLPRVLLVGDSIVLGSRSQVAKKLKGKVSVAAYSTSKIVGDEAFLRELKLMLADCPIDMLCFNNGLHGLNYEADFYRKGLVAVIDFLQKEYPQIKLVWRNSTPITVKGKPSQFDKRNAIVLARNQVASEVMKERNVPVYDLYTITAEHPEWSCGDSFHYNTSGWDKIADFTMEMILRELPKKPIKPTGEKMEIKIDFKKRTGRVIRPLHGINNCRTSLYKPMPELQEAGIPFVRLHDFGGMFGSNAFVDIPNLFPDFNADENDPKSYRFEYTDALFKQLTASGPQIFFRLGISIENNWRLHAYRTMPPADFGKWARICEHVVRHYNEGWNNGFHYGIQYWEIWNEPEQPSMWSGTREQYFELYKAASLHLKKCFPNIKIGGYASCGFYAVSEPEQAKLHPFYKTMLPWFQEFLQFVKKERLPLDFFSWHRYLKEAKVLIPEAKYVREQLDMNGFEKTESINNEWNYGDTTVNSSAQWEIMKNHIGASAVADIFITMQKETSIDKAMYYDARPSCSYGGLYYFPSQEVTPTYYSFKAFNVLYQKKNEVPVSITGKKGSVLAAADEKSCALLIANPKKISIPLALNISNIPGRANAWITDADRTFAKVRFCKEMELPPQSVLLVEWNGKERGKTKVSATHGAFNGISGDTPVKSK